MKGMKIVSSRLIAVSLAAVFAVLFCAARTALAASCVYGYNTVSIKCVDSAGGAVANGASISSAAATSGIICTVTALNSVDINSPPAITNWAIALTSNPDGVFGLTDISSSGNTYTGKITAGNAVCQGNANPSFTLTATPKIVGQCYSGASFSASVGCPTTPPVEPPVTPPVQPPATPPGTPPSIFDPVINHPAATAAITAGAVLLAASLAPNIVASLANTALGGGFWNALTGFSFLFARRKKRKTGRVIEEGSGLPIVGAEVDLVVVKLGINNQPVGQRTVAKTRTDTYGEYLLAAAPGYYKLEVKKEPYFMSDNASRLRQEYEPNQILRVKNYEEGLVAPTVVMALSQTSISAKKSLVNNLRILERALHFVSYALMAFGTGFAAYNILYRAGPLNYIIGGAYLVLWCIIIYNSINRKGNSPWGEVFDEQNRKALPLALVRVMAPDGRRLIRTVVSDEGGKFAATVDRPNYRLIVSKPGYVMRNSVNVTKHDPQTKFINKRLPMRRGFLPATSEP